MPRRDTPEEAEIRAEIKKKKVTNVSPRLVLRIPKSKIEPLVMKGLFDWQVAKELGIGDITANQLRKFYDLPNCYRVKYPQYYQGYRKTEATLDSEPTKDKPKGLTVNVSVTDTELFKGILRVLAFAHEKTDDETKAEIERQLTDVIGRTHDIKRVQDVSDL